MAEKFISREKLGKKARKAMDSGKRRLWDCSPVSRIVESKKVYNRKRKGSRCRYDAGDGIFLLDISRLWLSVRIYEPSDRASSPFSYSFLEISAQ